MAFLIIERFVGEAKMELIKLTDNVYVMKERTINLGLITQGTKCIIIDTGLDKSIGGKINKLIKRENLELKAIIITHGHADHYGGNEKVLEQNNVPVYTSAWEANFLKEPILEPFSIFSGVNPPKIMQNKFYMAPASPAEDINEQEDFLKEWGLEVIPLPGHTLGMIGIKKEGVMFTGDAYYNESVLNKHPIPFLMDVDKLIDTLKWLKESSFGKYHVPSHQGIYKVGSETEQIIVKNIERLKDLYMLIENSIKYGPKTNIELIKIAFEKYNVKCSTFIVYQLVMVTINAYLSSMLDKGIIKPVIDDNILLWSYK